jgi:hypothetical protein
VRYVEKNFTMILIVLVALLMIAFAIWFFGRRIAKIEKRMRPQAGYTQAIKASRRPSKDFKLKTITINSKNRL